MNPSSTIRARPPTAKSTPTAIVSGTSRYSAAARCAAAQRASRQPFPTAARTRVRSSRTERSEEHTSELQSLMRISYAVFCLKKKTYHNTKATKYKKKKRKIKQQKLCKLKKHHKRYILNKCKNK